MTQTTVSVIPISPKEIGHQSRLFPPAASLGKRSIAGAATLLGNHALRFLIYTAGTSVLARTLTPDDFGLVTMTSSITGLLSVLGTQGVCTSTIQRHVITQRELTSLFWIILTLNVGLSLLALAFAPALAWLYGEPRVTAITMALASTLLLGGLTAPQFALLVRAMRYRAIAVSLTVPLMTGVVVGVGMALNGWGYWALVGMHMTQAATSTIAVWAFSSWRPSWFSRNCGGLAMLTQGRHVTAYDFLFYIVRNADNCLIGAFVGPEALGQYSKAYGLLLVPVNQINPPLNGVVLPSLSRLQNDPVRFREYYLYSITALTTISIPALVFSFIEAESLILLLLGPQWIESATIFRMLAPAAFVSTINLAPTWILTPLGRTGLQMRWACVMCPIILSGFAIGLLWGAVGVAASFSITFASCFLLFLADACRNSPVRFSELLVASTPAIGAGVVAGIVTTAWQMMDVVSPAAAFVVDAILFPTVYMLAYVTMPGGRTILRDLFMPRCATPCA